MKIIRKGVSDFYDWSIGSWGHDDSVIYDARLSNIFSFSFEINGSRMKICKHTNDRFNPVKVYKQMAYDIGNTWIMKMIRNLQWSSFFYNHKYGKFSLALVFLGHELKPQFVWMKKNWQAVNDSENWNVFTFLHKDFRKNENNYFDQLVQQIETKWTQNKSLELLDIVNAPVCIIMPVITCDKRWRYVDIITNPTLVNYNINPKVLHVDSTMVYTSIESAVLNLEEMKKDVMVPTNNEKVKKHGFEYKYAFRKEPQP